MDVQIDWRWTAILVVLGLLLSHWSPLIAVAAVLVGAFLALWGGPLARRHGLFRQRPKETYWRGRRIDVGGRDER
jgi:hypothetical protein